MKYLVINHKMNMNVFDIVKYVKELESIQINDLELMIAPSYVFIPYFINKNLSIVSQDVSKYNDFNYTGEVSCKQLKSLSVKYCIVGHYERRKYMRETNDDINSKISSLIDNDIIPICCIEENDWEDQISSVLDKFNNDVIFAYEPSYLIGANNIDDYKEISDSIIKIRDYVKSKYGIDIKIIYGGSVNSNTLKELEKLNLLDGYMVSSAGLDVNNIREMIKLLGAQ